MKPPLFLGLVIAISLLSSIAFAVPAGTFSKDIPKVSLNVQNADVKDVLAQIQQTTGIQVAIHQDVQGAVSVEFKDAEVEQAVDTVMQAAQGSWLRLYMLEADGPPQPPYSADDLLGFMRDARRTYMSHLSPEQRDALTAKWREMLSAAAGDVEHKVGARVFRASGPRPTAPTGGPMPLPNLGDLMRTYDPLRELVSVAYKDTVSVTLNGASLEDTVDAIYGDSGFMILCDEGLKGSFTLDLKDAEVEQALDQIAATVGAKWRRVYFVTKPRPQTQQELEKRFDDRFDQGVAEFWAKTPQERQQIIGEITQRLQNMPPQMRAMAKSFPFGKHILQKVLKYNTTLNTQQRQEIAPAVREVLSLFGGG